MYGEDNENGNSVCYVQDQKFDSIELLFDVNSIKLLVFLLLLLFNFKNSLYYFKWT